MGGKAKMTDEQKEKAFADWKAGAEWACIEKFIGQRNKLPGLNPPSGLEMGCLDISFNLQPYLDELFKMVQDLKVPGRKAKAYEQQFVRTMFFEKCETIQIDGNEYVISNGAMVDMWNCKEALCEIFNYMDDGTMDMNLTFETFTSWKKDLIKFCKEWDKLYVKHIKGTYPEMNGHHMKAMMPLTQLVESNVNFYNLENMEKNKKEYQDVPVFRHLALEEEFCKFLTGVCEIFKDYGELKDHFDIKQMLKVLKIANWKQIKPYQFYLTPLEDAIKGVRNDLLKMHKDGPLFMKYIIENNAGLQSDTQTMVKKDLTAQWLVGDELKQDQFKFFYDTGKIIYDSALQNKFIEANPAVLDTVLPEMIAFKSVMVIRDIQMRKADEIKKAKEKAELTGKPLPAELVETDPSKMTEEQIYQMQMDQKAAGGTGIEKSEAQLELEKEEKERGIYGRYWIWEGYFSDKTQEKWLTCAENLKHINDQVLQDIEDAILLKGFKGMKPKQIESDIENDHKQRIAFTKKLMPKDGEEYEVKALRDITKRKFMNDIRPPNYWNFIEEGPNEQKVAHVLRSNAKPEQCYEDGRVQVIMTAIEEIGMSLQRYEEAKWSTLRLRTLDIFKAEFNEYKKAVENA